MYIKFLAGIPYSLLSIVKISSTFLFLFAYVTLQCERSPILTQLFFELKKSYLFYTFKKLAAKNIQATHRPQYFLLPSTTIRYTTVIIRADNLRTVAFENLLPVYTISSSRKALENLLNPKFTRGVPYSIGHREKAPDRNIIDNDPMRCFLHIMACVLRICLSRFI